MQIKFRRASLAGPSDTSSAAARPIANIIQGANVDRRRSDNPYDPVNHHPISYADRLRPLQILTRDPAGNQYT
jgi:hypothetical protein